MSIVQPIKQGIIQAVKQGTGSIYAGGGGLALANDSIHFVDSNDYCETADSVALSPTSAVGLAAWVKSDVLPSSFQTHKIIDKAHVSGQMSYSMHLTNWGGQYRITFFISQTGSSSSPSCYFDAGSLSTGVWYHFAFTGTPDGTAPSAFATGWKNGVSQSILTGVAGTVSSIFDGTDVVRLGGNGADFWNGRIAEAQIWSTELTQGQVDTMQTNGTDPSSVGLEYYVKGDTNTNDISDNGHTVTDVDGTVVVSGDGPGA